MMIGLRNLVRISPYIRSKSTIKGMLESTHIRVSYSDRGRIETVNNPLLEDLIVKSTVIR